MEHSVKSKKAFLILEVVFAILLVGVAFGVFVHFYATSQNKQIFSLPNQNTAQEDFILNLKTLTNAHQATIAGLNGEFCEGEMIEGRYGDETLKFFEPKDCDKK